MMTGYGRGWIRFKFWEIQERDIEGELWMR